MLTVKKNYFENCFFEFSKNNYLKLYVFFAKTDTNKRKIIKKIS